MMTELMHTFDAEDGFEVQYLGGDRPHRTLAKIARIDDEEWVEDHLDVNGLDEEVRPDMNTHEAYLARERQRLRTFSEKLFELTWGENGEHTFLVVDGNLVAHIYHRRVVSIRQRAFMTKCVTAEQVRLEYFGPDELEDGKMISTDEDVKKLYKEFRARAGKLLKKYLSDPDVRKTAINLTTVRSTIEREE